MKTAKYLTPVITAFDQAGNLDRQANIDIWNHLISGGVDGIVLLGSAGEFCSMTPEQKQELIALAVEQVGGRCELIVGTGSMRVDDTVSLSNSALEAGADAVMAISPYYFALDDRSVEAFYDAVATGVKGDVYLYSYPDRTGYGISPGVTLSLLRKHRNIVGYKDSVSDFSHTRRLLAAVVDEFPDFQVYSGFDEYFAHNVLSGGCGSIGALSIVYPALCSAWAGSVNTGDLQKTAAIQQVIDKLMGIYDMGTPFMPVVKRALQLKGIQIKDASLAPVVPVSQETGTKLQAFLADMDARIQRLLG